MCLYRARIRDIPDRREAPVGSCKGRENDGNMRKRIIDRVKVIGAEIDDANNKGVRGIEKCLSSADSKVAVWLIPTNEELMIARDAYRFVK